MFCQFKDLMLKLSLSDSFSALVLVNLSICEIEKFWEVSGECEASVLWFVSSWTQMVLMAKKGTGFEDATLCARIPHQ